MPLATADQFSLYRRRCVGAVLIEIVAILLAPVAAVLAFVLLGEQGIYPKVAAAVSLLVVFFLGQAVRRACFRCPVCGAALPRGPRHAKLSEFFNGRCNQCGTEFQRAATSRK